MTDEAYAIGIDFGTESGRAVLVDCADGRECATRVYAYENGVIDERLPAPHDDVDARAGLGAAGPGGLRSDAPARPFPSCSRRRGIDPGEVIGVGIDFTACTMLPTLADGTPLCELDELRAEPHAWVKLWKHHAAQPEADRINAVAAERGEPWLRRYGGRISSEWFFAKALQILDEAPEVYARADRLIEAADWIVWQLTGVETRSSCTAGYKAMWSKHDGFPDNAYFAALDPRFEHVVDDKLSRQIAPIGSVAGGLSEQASAWTGLRAGNTGRRRERRCPRFRACGHGHAARNAGRDHGNEHLPHPPRRRSSPMSTGCAALSRTASCRGSSATKRASRPSATSSPGSSRTRCRAPTTSSRRSAASTSTSCWRRKLRGLRPGESGLLALDWWNGNRSVLVDADLRGLLVGMTLATRAPEIYRALIEATAFGTRVIIEAFESAGVDSGRGRRLRRAPRAEQAPDADLRRRDRAQVHGCRHPDRRRHSDPRSSARSPPAPRPGDTTRSSMPPGTWVA